MTYGELLEQVSTFAGVLADRGVGKGDTVLIYMPMIPEAVVAMLATARRSLSLLSCTARPPRSHQA